MTTSDCDNSISVVGTCCPMPLVRMAEAITAMQPGQVLKITGDDPFFESGVRDYCLARGYDIVGASSDGRAITVLIRV